MIRIQSEKVKVEANRWKHASMGSVIGDSPQFRHIEGLAVNKS